MRILFIVSRFPYPLEKGDKLRAYQHLMNLKSSGHEVHLVAISDQPVESGAVQKIQPLCKTIAILPLKLHNIFINVIASFFRKIPLQVGYFYSEGNQKKVDKVISDVNPDLIYCQLIRTACYVRNYNDKPLVIDYQDAFSKGTLQRMQAAAWWIKPLYSRELSLVKKIEAESYEWFDGHIIISKQDKAALAIDQNKSISIVPNGVDTSLFFREPADKKADITFVGNMNYPPNVDAACFLVEEIMPLVWKQLPDAKVQIAGANPNKKVRELASGFVYITGWVEDIRHCYRSSKIFVAPMRTGTGLQNKLLEAMAMGIPCVTTPLSFEPLGATPAVDILVAKEAAEIAERIIRLLNSEDLRNEIGNNGLKFVRANYSMEHSMKLLDQVLHESVVKFKAKRHQ